MADYSNPIRKVNAVKTIKDLLNEGNAKPSTGDVNPNTPMDLIPLPTRFEMPKALSADQFKSFVKKIPKTSLEPVASVLRDKLDPRYKGTTHDFVTNILNYTSVSPDVEMFRHLEQIWCYSYEGKNRVTLIGNKRSLASVTQFIVADGPEIGLITRLCGGLTQPKVPWTIRLEPEAETTSYSELLGFKIPEKRLFESPDLLTDFVEINYKSSAGFPFCVLKDACVAGDKGWWAILIDVYNRISTGRLLELTRTRPELFLVALKNKLDRYEKVKLEEKIRPYYVYPAHLSVLFSIVMQYMSLYMLDFTRDPKSSVVVGFSWNKGGGQKLYNYCARKEIERFVGIAFADDALWKFTTDDGVVVIVTPDVKWMDMSLHASTGSNAYTAFTSKSMFGDALSPTWKGVLKLMCNMAFTHVVVMKDSYTFIKKAGLSSGATGTTWFDQIMSTEIIVFVKEYMKHIPPGKFVLPNQKVAEEFVLQLTQAITKKYGLVFKPETLEPHYFVKNQDSYFFTFLGQTLVKVKGSKRFEYVHCTPEESILKSLCLPRKTYPSGNAKISGYMERYRGTISSSGFVHEFLYEAVKKKYQILRELGGVPRESGESIDSFVEEIQYEDQEFPTREWIINLYLSEDNSVAVMGTNHSPTDQVKIDGLYQSPGMDFGSMLLGELNSTNEQPEMKSGKEEEVRSNNAMDAMFGESDLIGLDSNPFSMSRKENEVEQIEQELMDSVFGIEFEPEILNNRKSAKQLKLEHFESGMEKTGKNQVIKDLYGGDSTSWADLCEIPDSSKVQPEKQEVIKPVFEVVPLMQVGFAQPKTESLTSKAKAMGLTPAEYIERLRRVKQLIYDHKTKSSGKTLRRKNQKSYNPFEDAESDEEFEPEEDWDETQNLDQDDEAYLEWVEELDDQTLHNASIEDIIEQKVMLKNRKNRRN